MRVDTANQISHYAPMEFTYLGRSGLRVSRLCLGTYNFGTMTDKKEAFRIMDAALDAGINFFDTANHYPDFVNCGRTESFIGEWLAQGNNRRERIVLATKVYQPMKNPADGPNDDPGLSLFKIRRHFEGSLRRLQTDHIELYQMHHIDRRAGWDEIWEAFQGLVRQGKVDYVGSSNFPAWQMALAQSAAKELHFLGLVSEQHKYNLLCRLPELEVLPAARALGIGILIYSPLASGILAGKETSGESRRTQQRENARKYAQAMGEYEQICGDMGSSEAIVSLAWLLAQPAVTSVIIGPRTEEQLISSIKCLDSNLTATEISQIDTIFPGPGGPAPEAYAW